MKRLLNITLLYFLILLLIFTGCATVEETLYLRQAKVTGPIASPPIHLTDSTDTPSLTVSPRFTFNTNNKPFTGKVAQYTSYFAADTTFVPLEHSLFWDITNISAGVDMDLALSKSFAITFGANYSTHSYYRSLGGNISLGFFEYKNETAIRFDAGMQINVMQYDAYTVVHSKVTSFWGNTNTYTGFYHDINKSTNFDPYFNFTYNTAYKSWPVNIFINLGYSIQTLFDFSPTTSYQCIGGTEYITTDLRGSLTAGFFNFTPGIYFILGESNRILLGSRFFVETLLGSGNPKFFILPMIQLDFRL